MRLPDLWWLLVMSLLLTYLGVTVMMLLLTLADSDNLTLLSTHAETCSKVFRYWYLIMLDLQKIMVAVSGNVVNYGRTVALLLDPMPWDKGRGILKDRTPHLTVNIDLALGVSMIGFSMIPISSLQRTLLPGYHFIGFLFLSETCFARRRGRFGNLGSPT